MCRAFGQRPSTVLGIDSPEEAYDFDIAMNLIHRTERISHIQHAVTEQQDPTAGLLTAALFED